MTTTTHPQPPAGDDTTWAAWATTALEAGEPAVAERLLRHLLQGEALNESGRRWAASAVAGCLAQQGRAADGAALLAEARLGPPADPGTAGWSHVVAAAVAACEGDETAYRWLLSIAVATEGTAAHSSVVEMLAAAADGRHDGVADDAWAVLVRRYGARDPHRVARFTATVLLRRDRQAPPATLRSLLAASADNLMGVSPDALTDPAPAQEVAAQLVARDDWAGTALLQRALSRRLCLPGDRGVLHVVRTPWWYPLLGALAVLVVVAIGVAGPPLVTTGAVVALLLGRVAWAHAVPRPGLTRQESRAWRTLGTDAGGTPVRAGVALAACLVGVAIALSAVVAAIALDQAGPEPSWFTERAPLVWLGTPTLAGWAALGIAVEVARISRIRDERRRRRAPAALGPDGTCRCLGVIGYTGTGARDYLAGHLVRSDEVRLIRTVRAVFPLAVVARCPITDAVWLCGPLGRYGRPLALRGPVAEDDPATEASAAGAEPAGSAGSAVPAASGQGFYL